MNQNEEIKAEIRAENNEVNYTVINRKTIMKCRHKAERRWFRRLVILNILILIGIGALFGSALKDNRDYFHDLKDATLTYVEAEGNSEEAASKKLDELLEEFPDSISTAFWLVLLLLTLPLILYYTYAGFRSMSVKITERNFPEIHEIVLEYAERLGMKEIPTIYLVQGNGLLNAFASCVPFKQYI
ncbi:MAG: hypothetical protein AAGU75_24225, partial [Bacillota bacterium]